MDYISTRKERTLRGPAAAILEGIAPDGGLYVPARLPELDNGGIARLCSMPYEKRAARILSSFLTDFSEEELGRYARAAYRSFDGESPAPLSEYGENTFLLELYHGPTCAFKDMALALLPRLMTGAMEKTGSGDEICILTATSGDTGKAALEGFADVPGTKILVFYPADGVSPTQELQMLTQKGENVSICAVRGNFDDAQTGVKALFADRALNSGLNAAGISLSSANSINWGRLAPQIVYYISAYCDLLNKNRIAPGEKINICVPTGNFGNILAGLYAKKMGLPIDRLICASNRNNVLTGFLNTGTYDKNREFFKTPSPSMDILVSSNVERMIFELSGHDGGLISGLMAELSRSGAYALPGIVQERVREHFSAGWCGDEECFAAIRRSYEEAGFLADPHTAVALNVLSKYREETGDSRPCVVAATASPYKFAGDVYFALTGARLEEQAAIGVLAAFSGQRVPAPLAGLSDRPRRFGKTVGKEEMGAALLEFLGI